jgi:hypothetical protein
VDGEVRFGQHDGAGDAMAVELVEKVTQAGEPGLLYCVEAGLPEEVTVSQVACITSAAIQIGDNMKTLQFA